LCVSRNTASLDFLVANENAGCGNGPAIGRLEIELGPVGTNASTIGDWHLFEYGPAPTCAPMGETGHDDIRVAGVCCETQFDVSFAQHDVVFRVRVVRDWEPGPVVSDDGGTGSDCSSVCAHTAALCGVSPSGCEASCAALSVAQRECLAAVQSCNDVPSCVGHDG
jgi:hypothetical protein